MDADPCQKQKAELEAAVRELRQAHVARGEYAVPEPEQYAALLANAFNGDSAAREAFLEKLIAWADCRQQHMEHQQAAVLRERG